MTNKRKQGGADHAVLSYLSRASTEEVRREEVWEWRPK